jgi:hypothetical protein
MPPLIAFDVNDTLLDWVRVSTQVQLGLVPPGANPRSRVSTSGLISHWWRPRSRRCWDRRGERGASGLIGPGL